jgi:hypothetical protein
MNDERLGAELRKQILWCQAVEKATSEKKKEYEGIMLAAGYRIVSGEICEDGYWYFTDKTTGELLESGVGQESFLDAGEDNWANEDAAYEWSMQLVDESDLVVNHTSALPESLRELLYDWANFYPEDVSEMLAD